METITHKITRSRRAFARRHAILFNKTRSAGVDVLDEAGRYASFVRRETDSWRAFAATRGNHAVHVAKGVLAADGLERGLLTHMAWLLEGARGRVGARLEALDGAERPQLPLPDYDNKTARAILAVLAALDDDACRRIYEFEGNNKQRTTVLRALEQRLAN